MFYYKGFVKTIGLLFLHLYCISGRRNVVSLFDGKYCETEFKTDNSCPYYGDFYIIQQTNCVLYLTNILQMFASKIPLFNACLVILFI